MNFPHFWRPLSRLRELPYLADVARLEAARTRAYHAADAIPLEAEALHALSPQMLPDLRFTLHPACEIVASDVSNRHDLGDELRRNGSRTDQRLARRGCACLAPSASMSRCACLPPGAKTFLQSLAAGQPLGTAAAAALAASVDFDLAVNLAALFAGLAIHMNERETLP